MTQQGSRLPTSGPTVLAPIEPQPGPGYDGQTAERPSMGPPIYFRLLMPVTRVGIGVFSFDPLEKLLGCTVESILKDMLVGPVEVRATPQGPAVRVFPLAIPAGDGAGLRLGKLGEIAFFNDRGFLQISAPLPASGWLQQRLAPWLVRGPEQVPSIDRTSVVAAVWVCLQPGLRAAVPVTGIGEIGLESW